VGIVRTSCDHRWLSSQLYAGAHERALAGA
jgi:hypothetical protein